MTLGDDIRKIRFTPVRFREGYDMQDVDEFLDLLAAAADRGESLRDMVDRARFSPARMRASYDMGEVDVFLERAASTSPEPAAVPTTPPVVDEQRGLLSRVFGRGA